MQISKFGHACLLIEEQDVRILIDPGSYSSIPNIPEQLNAIFITHEHADHVDDSLMKKIVEKNPHVSIFTTLAVQEMLRKEEIDSVVVHEGQGIMLNNIEVQIVGKKHAVIYETIPQIDNFGVLIDNSFFYPGDNFTLPHPAIKILALPVTAPWLNISEAIDYALEVKPKICFPTHNGILKDPEMSAGLCEKILQPQGIEWVVIKDGENREIVV